VPTGCRTVGMTLLSEPPLVLCRVGGGSVRGYVAHVMYRWRGEPLSLYVLNGAVNDIADASRDIAAHDTVVTRGEQAVMWTNKGRTYAVVARGRQEDVERVAAYFRSASE